MHATDEIIYNGKRIKKNQFRAFIFSVEGQSKLVNSWGEYEGSLASGIWFSSKDKIPKAKPQKKKSQTRVIVNGLVEEDFLPNDVGE